MKLIVIAGPTASGKTATAIAAAQALDGEIVSADSMQVYRGMDIGTAKATAAERAAIPHHVLDVADPSENFSAALYQQYARAAIADIHARGKVPILVGGTGFYINSVVWAWEFGEDTGETPLRVPNESADLRDTPENLHRQLVEVDPATAAILHPNNVKRVTRALAYYHATGKPFSEHNATPRRLSYTDTSFFVLHYADRARLYERIDQRVVQMFDQGLIHEVERLLAAGVDTRATAFQGLGYKEVVPYLEGRVTLDDTIALIQQRTRRYAKRQLTWFRHQSPPNAQWVECGGSVLPIALAVAQ